MRSVLLRIVSAWVRLAARGSGGARFGEECARYVVDAVNTLCCRACESQQVLRGLQVLRSRVSLAWSCIGLYTGFPSYLFLSLITFNLQLTTLF